MAFIDYSYAVIIQASGFGVIIVLVSGFVFVEWVFCFLLSFPSLKFPSVLCVLPVLLAFSAGVFPGILADVRCLGKACCSAFSDLEK